MGDFFNLTMEVKTLVEENGRFRASLNDIRSHDDTDSRCDELELDFEVIGLPQYRFLPNSWSNCCSAISICCSRKPTLYSQ